MTSTIKVLFYVGGRHPALCFDVSTCTVFQTPSISRAKPAIFNFSVSLLSYLCGATWTILFCRPVHIISGSHFRDPQNALVTILATAVCLIPLLLQLTPFTLMPCNYPLPLDLRSLPRFVASNVFPYGSPPNSPLPPRCLFRLFVLSTCSRFPLYITP